MPKTFPEPSHELSDPAGLFVRYLDFYRATVEAKLDGLSDEQLRSTVLPSGWTALEMLKHLVFMEQRWFVWGFLGEHVAEPWDDRDTGADRWVVREGESAEELLAALRTGGVRTTELIQTTSQSAHAADSGRFAGEEQTPTLAWICFHVLQEYARHTGHLDVVRELIDGTTGE